MRIAFQGASGAYREAAALKAWPEAEVIACDRFEEVFAAVAGGRVSHGILPVENSIGGSIHINYDLLLQHDLPIVAETELAVVHNLLALPGTTIAQIRRVLCRTRRRWLNANNTFGLWSASRSSRPTIPPAAPG